MNTKHIVGAWLLVSVALVGCDNSFKFAQVKVACEPPNSSARFGKNSGPIILSPEALLPFNTSALVKGSCVNGIPVILSGAGMSEQIQVDCQNGEFTADVKFNDGDGVKEVDVAQKTLGESDITDRRCFNQDNTPPVVKIAGSNGQQAMATRKLNLEGTCESGLDVVISGPHLLKSVTTSCERGSFAATIEFVGEDGLKNVEAKQIDLAGNRGNDDEDYLTDTIAPRVVIITPDALSLSQGQISLRGECEAGIPVILQGALQNTVTTAICERGLFSANIVMSAGDGVKNITATQTDMAGNRGTNNRDFMKDTTPPIVKISSPAAGWTTQGGLRVSGQCESGLTVEMTVAGGAPLNKPCANNEFLAEITLPAPDGAKEIVVKQTDAAGNSASDRRSFIRDNTAPILTIDDPAANSVWKNGLTLSGQCESNIEVRISGAGVNANTATACVSEHYSVALTFSPGEGVKNIIATQMDRLNNSTSVNRDFIRDSLAPVVNILSPADGVYVGVNITLTGNCETGLPVQISGSGVQAALSTACTGGSFTQDLVLTATDGQKEVRATQTDAVGNSSSDVHIYLKDTLAPVVKITSPAANSAWRDSLILQGNCESGLDVKITGDATTTITPCANNVFSSKVMLSAGDGVKHLVASQTDKAGLSGQDARDFMSRMAAPVVLITSPAANSYVTATPTITGTCETGLNVTINGPGLANTVVVACDAARFSSVVSLTSGEGLKEVVASQVDATGNMGSDRKSYIRDSVAPVVKIVLPAANTMTTSGLTITGTCEKGWPVSLAGTGVLAPVTTACNEGQFTAAIVLAPGDGIKNVVAVQVDDAGNSGTDNRDYILKTLGPVVKFSFPAEGAYVKVSETVTGICEAGLEVRLSGAGIGNEVKTSCVSGKFSQSLTFTEGDGEKQIVAQQTDGAGNSSRDTRTFKRDSTLPIVRITGPAAGTVAQSGVTLVGVCEMGLPVVIWGPGAAANLTANCSASTPPGSSGVFSVAVTFSADDGKKEIRASQTDAAGNVATDNRTFIKDATAPLVKITSPAEKSFVGEEAVISGTCEAGLNVVLTSSFAAAPIVTTPCGAAGVFSATVQFGTSSDVVKTTAAQTDVAGNVGSDARSFFHDTSKPVVKILAPAANSVFNSTFTLQGSCETGLAVNILGGVEAVAPADCTAATFSAVVKLSVGEGDKLVTVSQTDKAGHTGTDSRNFIRDSVAPKVEILSPIAGPVKEAKIALAGTCETGLVVLLNGAGLTSESKVMCAEGRFTLTTELSAGDGAKVVLASQTDAAGNIGSDKKTYTLDTSGPEVKIVSPANGTKSATGLTITGTCKTGLPVNLSGDVHTPVVVGCTNGSFTGDILFSPNVGAKKVTATQTDASNRTGSDTRNYVRSNNAGYETYLSQGPGGKVDILFVDDNSSSMEVEQKALGDRFSSFSKQLADVDWQAGIITTDCKSGSPYNFCGQLIDFNNSTKFISEKTPNYLDLFKSNIQRAETPDCWRSSSTHPCPASDEEGLRSTIESFKRRDTNNIGFFREGSDLAVVYLSDENELSTGPTSATKPSEVVSAFKNTWGTKKKMSAYAIIIKPGDTACLNAQKNQPGAALSANYGTFQNELAVSTGGMSVSICEPDYSVTLQRIGQDVTRLSRSYDLAKAPIANSVKVIFTPDFRTTFTLIGNRLTFDQVAPVGTKVEIFYEY